MYELLDILDHVDKETLEAIIRLIAKVEVRAKYEAAVQIASFIKTAKEKNLSIDQVEKHITDYMNWLDELLEIAVLEDPLYQLLNERIIKHSEKQEAKA